MCPKASDRKALMALGLVVADSITLVMHDVERMIATFLKASTGDIKDCGIS